MAYFRDVIAELIAELKNYPYPWLILLEGDLGVGKTTWTQEFVEALGGQASKVKSPTFLKVLAHRIPVGELLHMDAYRIEDSDEFLRLGLESYENAQVWVVEWPERFEEFLNSQPEFKSLLGLQHFVRLGFSMDSSGQRKIAKAFGRL